ncbi:MAG: GntR family transcriptional regulator, partial [Lachnospiraceae bacterium]
MGIKYKEVADQLRHEILSQNTYAGTKKLPTEQELMERYHVSRQTVRQALSI